MSAAIFLFPIRVVVLYPVSAFTQIMMSSRQQSVQIVQEQCVSSPTSFLQDLRVIVPTQPRMSGAINSSSPFPILREAVEAFHLCSSSGNGARWWRLPRTAGEKEPAAAAEPHWLLPHLLVVGAGNSFDPGPVGFGQEAKRGAGCCCCLAQWRGHVRRQHPLVFVDTTAGPNGLRYSDRGWFFSVQVRGWGRRLLPHRASRACMSGQARIARRPWTWGQAAAAGLTPLGNRRQRSRVAADPAN